MSGAPVVIATNGYGMAVRPVDSGAPVLTVAENGFGMPIVISDLGAPFVVEGLWSPEDMFTGTTQGTYFDPSDRATLYQDAAGTTPAFAPGDPVGLMLDKSKGLVLGPELITNGGFDTDTSWTKDPLSSGIPWMISGGRASISGSQTSATDMYQALTVVSGRFYELAFDYVSGAGLLTLQARALNIASGVNISVSPAAGTRVRMLFSTSGTPANVTFRAGGGVSAIIDNISVRELPGYHATQSVAASRPTLARHPKGGRRNLLTQTENFADAVWSKQNTAVAGQSVTTTTADLLTTSATIPAGANITYSERLKRGNHDWVRLTFLSGANEVRGWFNLATGAVGSQSVQGTGVAAGLGMSADGDGFWRCWIAGSVPAATSLVVGTASAAADLSFTRVTDSNRLMRGSQLELGTTATPYQRVTTAYDVTEAGVADLWYLAFDGVDDFMVTPAIDLTGTDKVGVFAGVRKLSDAAAGVIAELSAVYSSNNGAFLLQHGGLFNVDRQNFAFEVRGTANAWKQIRQYASPFSAVLSASVDLSAVGAANEVSFRVNGGPAGTTDNSPTDAGTGNFGNYPLYIGRRGGTSLPFNGNLYGLIVAGKMPTAAEIANTEAFINDKTGAY